MLMDHLYLFGKMFIQVFPPPPFFLNLLLLSCVSSLVILDMTPLSFNVVCLSYFAHFFCCIKLYILDIMASFYFSFCCSCHGDGVSFQICLQGCIIEMCVFSKMFLYPVGLRLSDHECGWSSLLLDPFNNLKEYVGAWINQISGNTLIEGT